MATAMGDVAFRCVASKAGDVVMFFAPALDYAHSGKLLGVRAGQP